MMIAITNVVAVASYFKKKYLRRLDMVDWHDKAAMLDDGWMGREVYPFHHVKICSSFRIQSVFFGVVSKLHYFVNQRHTNKRSKLGMVQLSVQTIF